MRLYGLVKNPGSTDVILRQSVETLCTVSRNGSKAVRALGSSSIPLLGGDHHALFDPIETRWCFAATDIDIYHFHPETQKQGALT